MTTHNLTVLLSYLVSSVLFLVSRLGFRLYPAFSVLAFLTAAGLCLPHTSAPDSRTWLSFLSVSLEGGLMLLWSLSIVEVVSRVSIRQSPIEIFDTCGLALTGSVCAALMAKELYSPVTLMSWYKALRFTSLTGMSLFMLLAPALVLARPFRICRRDRLHYILLASLLTLHPLTAIHYSLRHNWYESRLGFLLFTLYLSSAWIWFVWRPSRRRTPQHLSQHLLHPVHSQRR